jgi:hypothetical protein
MKLFIRISAILFFSMTAMLCSGRLFSQEIRVDTIKVNKTRTLKIVSVMSVPKFILQFSGSFNSGALELTSHNGGFSRYDYLTGRNFGARNGFGFNLIGKLPLNKKGQFWLDVITGFARFQSDLIAKNTEEGSVAYNSINGGIGIEYNFTPYHKVKYFFGANPLLSIITGKATLINPDNNRVDLKVKSNVRIGYSVFMGLEYAFDRSFGLNTGLRFTHANLLLKKTEDPGTDPVEIGLNDDSTPTENPIQFAGWKQFAYISVYAGISYFFGVKVNRYKLP